MLLEKDQRNGDFSFIEDSEYRKQALDTSIPTTVSTIDKLDLTKRKPIADVAANFSKLQAVGEQVLIAGRIQKVRKGKKTTFFDISDQSGFMQVLVGDDNPQI